MANPFNPRQITRVSLLPENILAFVFWTRNGSPLFEFLPRLEDQIIPFYFNWTLNNYPNEIEQSNPQTERMIEKMHVLAQKHSTEALVWRYDPILISNKTPISWHVENFGNLCEKLRGTTTDCIISFLDVYRKTQRNLEKLSPDLRLSSVDQIQEIELTSQLSKIAETNGIVLFSCCEDHLVENGCSQKARCVDLDRLKKIEPTLQAQLKFKPTRNECGCFESVDIGSYDSCVFKCAYCYANQQFDTKSQRRYKEHNPKSKMLI